MTKPLSPEQLYTPCDVSQFNFDTTDQLAGLTQVVGQDRAIKALQFGIGIQQPGFNLFVLGSSGLGKHTVVRNFLREQAKYKSQAMDWCYVNNFDVPEQPIAIQLEPGQSIQFRTDMRQLVDDLRSAIPSAFEAEEYHDRVQDIEEGLKNAMEAEFDKLTHEAESHQITLTRTRHGFAFTPMRDKQAINEKEFEKLPKKEQTRLEEIISALEDKLAAVMRLQPQWQRETRNKIKDLNQEIVMSAAGHLIDDLKNKYLPNKPVQKYLDTVLSDVINNPDIFQRDDENRQIIDNEQADNATYRRYEVNILVSHNEHEGAPVVFEDNPSYPNLVGAVEHTARLGALITDFTLIKSGALHKANGGYLIIDINKLLQQPYAWEGLKRALSSREIKIQSLAQIYSLISTVSLEPQPIPLNLKVVLIGDRILYYLLHEHDPEFKHLFKIAADFDDQFPRNPENQLVYAQLITTMLKNDRLLPFDRSAVARVIEHSSRLAGDANKLSIEILHIADLLRESDYWARQDQHQVVTHEHVQEALNAQIYRHDRIREHIQEQIVDGTLMIDTSGTRVGQVNGLTVIELGNFSFSTPTRITATVRLGEGEVIDIEREVELGGSTHSKGVFILSAYLGQRFANDRPMSLSASLTFEQSYGYIDGDSASMAELCALLSVLSDYPIQQNLAITGSVNQYGEAQAIGSVNEKIEGFFDICKATGLTDKQGVLIPANNIKHLMLDKELINACKNKQFSVYSYSNIDQAISLLCNKPAEKINKKIEQRIAELEKYREEYSRASRVNNKENE